MYLSRFHSSVCPRSLMPALFAKLDTVAGLEVLPVALGGDDIALQLVLRDEHRTVFAENSRANGGRRTSR